MKKTKILSILAITLLSLSSVSAVSAMDINTTTRVDSNSTINVGSSAHASVSGKAETNMRGTGGPSDQMDQQDQENNNNNNEGVRGDMEDNSNIRFDTQAHGDAMKAFMNNLLNIANRETNIGADVKVIAKEQSDSDEVTSSSIAKIESRNRIKTWLIGTDFKNIDVLKAEIAKTNDEIAKLQTLSAKVTNQADKDAINAQIKVLQDEQVKINDVIAINEKSFSLFGWFVKMFNK